MAREKITLVEDEDGEQTAHAVQEKWQTMSLEEQELQHVKTTCKRKQDNETQVEHLIYDVEFQTVMDKDSLSVLPVSTKASAGLGENTRSCSGKRQTTATLKRDWLPTFFAAIRGAEDEPFFQHQAEVVGAVRIIWEGGSFSPTVKFKLRFRHEAFASDAEKFMLGIAMLNQVNHFTVNLSSLQQELPLAANV